MSCQSTSILIINVDTVIWFCVCLGDKKIHSDIDESKVKAPNMFERAKEEFEAVIGAMHQHKSSRFVSFFLVIKLLLFVSNAMNKDTDSSILTMQ